MTATPRRPGPSAKDATGWSSSPGSGCPVSTRPPLTVSPATWQQAAARPSNSPPGVPAAVEHGSSLHHELGLPVDAGLSTAEALRAATVLPARHFRLADRGGTEHTSV